MAKLRYIINDVVEVLKQYSDDANISQEHIAYNINTARAMLLQQKYGDRGSIIPQKLRQHFYHTLELTEENEFSAGLGTILRTVDPIQNPLEPFNFKSNIKISTGSYLDPYFVFVSIERFPYVGRNKWNQNQIYVTLGSDFRLYFTSANPKVKIIENVKLSYVTENPEEAYLHTIDYDANVDFWDVEYPLEEDIIVHLTDYIIKKLSITLQIPEDKNNNSDDA
jgi:hypothetical protein